MLINKEQNLVYIHFRSSFQGNLDNERFLSFIEQNFSSSKRKDTYLCNKPSQSIHTLK